jgi:hypothetical protein
MNIPEWALEPIHAAAGSGTAGSRRQNCAINRRGLGK